jgi:nucleoside-diphosphate-sugar epimerase
MKVLVVGGGGFLGSETVKSLIACGFAVKSVSRNFSSIIDCEQIIADIIQPDSYQNIFTTWKPEIVIQAAWVTNQKTYRTSPRNLQYMEATVELAEQGYRSGVEHFLALGSCAEYGIPTEPCNALTTPAAPVDFYGSQKLETLIKLKDLAGKYSCKLSWARIFQPYGPNQDSRRLLPFARQELLAGNKFKVAHPNAILDWISSRDVASALTYAVKCPVNDIFDVGTSIPIPVMQVLKSLVSILNVDSNLLDCESMEKSDNSDFSIVASKQSPLFNAGWSPLDDLVSGLKWTLAA